MAAWEIDRFSVRPSGVFANWRYKRVLIDELGNITTAGVPGKEEMNLPCLGDYKKRDRRFSQGQLITEFCNLTTHTNYRVYAQDCTPFAYVQTDLNAAKCGYVTPIAAPFVPPNPFGTAEYGLYAYLNYCDNKNVPINIKIFRRGYEDTPIKINHGGASPAVISYKNNNDNKFVPLRSCELRLTFVSDASFNLEKFYTEDEREFKIQIIKAGITKFFGFGTASEASEEFAATPYDVTWRATDGLGGLKKIDYPMPIGSKTDIQQKFIEILCFCLARTNLNLNISTICNLYEVKMSTSLDDDPLNQSTVSPMRFIEKGKVMNCYQVLEAVCKEFGAFIVQDNGAWHFVRQSELANDILRQRTYNDTGFFLGSRQFSNKRVATCKGTDITILDDKTTLVMGNAYKRAEVIVDFGEPPFLLFNGDFELYDGFNFPGWTKYGGIEVSRVEKKIKTTTGEIPSGNFALQFDKRADNAKYIESGKIQVYQKDKITLAFNVSKTTQNNPTSTTTTPNPGGGRPIRGGNDIIGTPTTPAPRIGPGIPLKLRIKLGEYYLTNPNGDNEYTWVAQLVTCTIMVNNPSDTIDAFLVSLDIPEAPVSNTMQIQIYGFVVTNTIYYPVYIDNINISRSSENKTVGRVLYVTQQDGFYTTKPEPTTLLFGDYGGLRIVDTLSRGTTDRPRPTRGNSFEITEDHYAIRTKDGSYSTGWYEFGGPTTPIPIGLALSQSIMKAYQKPFRFLEGSFLGNNISYLDIFNVNLPNNTDFNDRIFALLSGDFDLVSGEVKNANYVEIFSKPGKTVDIVLPGKNGDALPLVSQNPNPEPGLILLPNPDPGNDGIFTREFTPEFT